MYDLSSYMYTDLASSSSFLPLPRFLRRMQPPPPPTLNHLFFLHRAASSTTFITHFRSHLATFQTLCHLLGGLKLGGYLCEAKRREEKRESCRGSI